MNEFWCDYTNGNDTTGDGSIGLPWKTINYSLNQVAIVGGILYLSDDSFPAENINLSTILATSTIRVVATKQTSVIIRTFNPGLAKIMFQNGTYACGTVSFTLTYDRRILFDNCTVAINATFPKIAIFYHCNVVVNSVFSANMFIDCSVSFSSEEYWYAQSEFYYYFCKITGVPEDQLFVKVPLYDKLSMKDLMDDIKNDDLLEIT